MRDLSLHLMDIIQNSVSAKASRIEITISTDSTSDKLIIIISDNGHGMDKDFLQTVTSPFATTRTTRKIGLGLPLFKESAEAADGEFIISSVKNEGTTLAASFKISHIDRLPLGDIADTMIGVITAYPDIQWLLILNNQKDLFTFDSFEIKEKLAGVSIIEHEVVSWIRDYIDEAIRFIFGGVLDEIVS